MANRNTGSECAINEEGMVSKVIINGVKYKLVPLKDPSENASEKKKMSEPKPSMSHSEALDEIFKIPAVMKKGGCHVSGLLRCVSSEKFQSIMRERRKIRKRKKKRKKSRSSYMKGKMSQGAEEGTD